MGCARTRDEPQAEDDVAGENPHAARGEEATAGQAVPSYLRDFIYGAVDGAITTFAVVAGVAGANLDETVVIMLRGANLLADGFSMAVSNFLGSRAERQQRERALGEEQRQIRLLPEGEREEIHQIFAAKGFEGKDLERVVEVITSDPKVWAETMMSEELGYGSTEPNECCAAFATLAAFPTVGFLPLTVFIYDLAAHGGLVALCPGPSSSEDSPPYSPTPPAQSSRVWPESTVRRPDPVPC